MPGSAFSYGPSHYYVFGVLLQRKLQAAGINQNPLQYLESRILDRTGVEYASWFHDDAGKNRMYIVPGRDAVIARQTTGDISDFSDSEFLDLLLGPAD